MTCPCAGGTSAKMHFAIDRRSQRAPLRRKVASDSTGWIGQIVWAGQRTRLSGGATEYPQDHQEQLDPAHAVRRDDLLHEWDERIARAAGEQRTTPGKIQQCGKARKLRHDLH